MKRTYLFVSLFIAAIAAANLSAAYFGPKATVINAFLLIGLDLSLRDKLHDRWVGNGLAWKMGAMIGTGGIVAYLICGAAGPIALASCVAFMASSLVDAGVYHAVRPLNFIYRANTSNLAGAAVDSILFPTLAFGVLMPEIVLGQFAAKVLGGALWAWGLTKIRN